MVHILRTSHLDQIRFIPWDWEEPNFPELNNVAQNSKKIRIQLTGDKKGRRKEWLFRKQTRAFNSRENKSEKAKL